MPIEINSKSNPLRTPWNKGRLVGQKRPLRSKEVWAIRVRLQIKHNKRDLAMFNLAIDSKLRGCDLVSLRVDDIAVGGHVRDRATIIQRKTGRPVQFEITEQTRASLQDWLNARPADRGPYVFPSRVYNQPHVTARQYARVVHGWIEGPGWTAAPTARIRCAAPRRRRSTARPAICERSSCFSGTRRSRARSVILGSRSVML
jgi:integrase